MSVPRTPPDPAPARGLGPATQHLRLLLGHAPEALRTGDARPGDVHVARLLEEARTTVRRDVPGHAGSIALAAIELVEAREAHARESVQRRINAVRGVQTALATLHESADIGRLYDAATKALCEHCAFDRVLLFGIEGEELVTRSVHFVGHDEWAAEILELGRGPGRPQLADMLRETDMVRRRRATVVSDAQNDPNTPRVLVEATRTQGYVAAPILPRGRVIGFLHADHHFRGRPVDEIDRDTLMAFAEGCGYAFERTFLRSALQDRRDELEQLARKSLAIVEGLSEGEVALTDAETRALDASHRVVDVLAPESPDDGALATLTGREQEVLRLLVEGETNPGIARRLFISDSTAKAHVGHILRKLGAANRADAVSRYLRPRDSRFDGG